MNSAKFGHQKLLAFMWVINGHQANSKNRQKIGSSFEFTNWYENRKAGVIRLIKK